MHTFASFASFASFGLLFGAKLLVRVCIRVTYPYSKKGGPLSLPEFTSVHIEKASSWCRVCSPIELLPGKELWSRNKPTRGFFFACQVYDSLYPYWERDLQLILFPPQVIMFYRVSNSIHQALHVCITWDLMGLRHFLILMDGEYSDSPLLDEFVIPKRPIWAASTSSFRTATEQLCSVSGGMRTSEIAHSSGFRRSSISGRVLMN